MNTYLRPRARGFTLIELLVVIAIIAILIALLVPTVQKIRESAARATCQNNMKQLAIGCHSFHDVNKRLPEGVQANASVNNPSDQNQNFGPNWAVLVLPYIEQKPLWDTVADSVQRYMTNNAESAWRSVRGTRLSIFICPSDTGTNTPYSGVGGNWARGNYACNSGPGLFSNWNDAQSQFSGSAPPQVRIINPGSGNGYPAAAYTCAAVMSANFGITLNTIFDGTSNTVLLDEFRVGPAATDLRGCWALGTSGASISAGAGRADTPYPNFSLSGGDDVNGCTDSKDMGCCSGCGNWQVIARSRHPGGVNTAFSDGTVRFMRNDIGQIPWLLLHSASDGQTVNLDNQ